MVACLECSKTDQCHGHHKIGWELGHDWFGVAEIGCGLNRTRYGGCSIGDKRRGMPSGERENECGDRRGASVAIYINGVQDRWMRFQIYRSISPLDGCVIHPLLGVMRVDVSPTIRKLENGTSKSQLIQNTRKSAFKPKTPYALYILA